MICKGCKTEILNGRGIAVHGNIYLVEYEQADENQMPGYRKENGAIVGELKLGGLIGSGHLLRKPLCEIEKEFFCLRCFLQAIIV